MLATVIIFYAWLAVGLIYFSGSYSNTIADTTTVLFIAVWVFAMYVIFRFKKGE